MLFRFKHLKLPSKYVFVIPDPTGHFTNTAFGLQAARMLLRVDDVVQATRKDKEQSQGPPPEEMMEG
jgi:DNA topoisomerase IB